MKFNLDLPDDLHKNLKIYVVNKKGLNMNNTIVKAISEYLENEKIKAERSIL
jgi:hypothetical protein